MDHTVILVRPRREAEESANSRFNLSPGLSAPDPGYLLEANTKLLTPGFQVLRPEIEDLGAVVGGPRCPTLR